MRQIISLDGVWSFTPDLDPEYHGVECYKDPHCDRSNWERVPVPACWNKYSERYALFEGVTWYAKEFYLKEREGDEIAFLRFGGVNYLAHIFLNGKLVGEHEGGYTEFLIDVTTCIREGKNLLMVRADNRRNLIKLPAVMCWFNYGGIHRSVQLELSKRARIENLLIDAFPSGTDGIGRVRAILKLKDNVTSMKSKIKIFAPDGNPVWEKSEIISPEKKALRLDYTFQIENPLLWNPESPFLYQCAFSIKGSDGGELDSLKTNFGVRKLSAEGRALLLNGKKIRLKGICCLCDHPDTGIALKEEVGKEDLTMFQELGVNALRSHFPLPEMMLDECDRRGMMLWLDGPVFCLSPKNEKVGSEFSQSEYLSLAKQILKEMMMQTYNHPSVLFWCIGNECNTSHPEAKEFFEGLANEVRKIDSSRLISYASLYTGVGCVAEMVDVIGVNEYWGWYDRCFEETEGELDLGILERELGKLIKEHTKPIILSEFGADAVPGYRAKETKLWSEDYQKLLLESTFKVAKTFPEISGIFPFLYNDYPDPSKPLNKYWKGLNLKGIVSYDRKKKIAFNLLKNIYSK